MKNTLEISPNKIALTRIRGPMWTPHRIEIARNFPRIDNAARTVLTGLNAGLLTAQTRQVHKNF